MVVNWGIQYCFWICFLVKGNNMDINFLLFDDFETLDAFGPVEILARLEDCPVHFFSIDGGSVTSKQGTVIKTKSADQIDRDGILVVPGGLGTRLLVEDEEFLEHLHQIADQSMYCLSVCTGSALLAKAGILEGRRATSNKRAFQWVKSVNDKVTWISRARWVVDGKFYSSSGVSAGMDMALGFVSDLFGRNKAEEIADLIEYEWNSEMEKDLFAKGN